MQLLRCLTLSMQLMSLMLIEWQMLKCSNIPMFQCFNVPLFQCSNDPMFKCSNVPVFNYSNLTWVHWFIVPLFHWSIGLLVKLLSERTSGVPRFIFIGRRLFNFNFTMFQCFNVPMFQYSNIPIFQPSIGPLVHWTIGQLVHWLKCCQSVPPEFLRSFLLVEGF